MTRDHQELNLALPDGHLMAHVQPFLASAGIRFEGYEKSNLNPRPRMRLEGQRARQKIPAPDLVAAKVIRPQDMPTHVANANFDLAISGTDWLREHKLRFPRSPVDNEPLLRLGFGRVRIVAAVHQERGRSLSKFMKAFRAEEKEKYLRIATEYVYIADSFAQRNDLHPYRIIMTYGATESLIPEDCDMIVENTETGGTLRKNKLIAIEEIMDSEACLIANLKSLEGPKGGLIYAIRDLFEECLKETGDSPQQE
jgi:ATP phosphoribosyltransferase